LFLLTSNPMATLKEIIYHIKNLKAKGVQSDDVKLSDREYMFMIDQYRARLIRQYYDKFKEVSPQDVQDLGYVAVEQCPADEMPVIGGFDMFRTERTIPRMVSTARGSLFTFVGHSPVDLPFQRTSLTKLPWDRHSKYTRAEPKWFDTLSRVYIATEQPINEVFILGVAESPYKVIEFRNELNYNDPYDFEYPLSITLLDALYKMIAEAEFKIVNMEVADTSNDGQEEQRTRQ
jgi:hypothetical protein